MRIGVIADTHGFFDPRIVRHFAGVSHIIHAGDIGDRSVIERLEAIAPVTAVTGNVDWGGPLERQYRRVARIERAGFALYIIHVGDDPDVLARHLPDPRPHVYIYGHSHIAHVEERDGVLFLNPGAAGKPRFGRQPSVAILHLDERPRADIVPL